jgi:3-hydroxyacyl-[acyl-carrier-protein] dehydratase
MRWMWIDRVVSLEPSARLVAIKNVSLAEEHLHDHFAADRREGPHEDGSALPDRPALPVMPMSLIVEGMAQTGGILVGHAHGFRDKVILAKISRAELERDATPGTTLRYTATIERMDASGATVAGVIELMDHADAVPSFAPVGRTEMLFSHLDQNMGAAGQAGSDFPAHNFVFGEAFKTLLRTSGIGGV